MEKLSSLGGGVEHNFFPYERSKVLEQIGTQGLLRCLQRMLLIRNFETRAEAAYLQGHIGGFFHSYIGQEAIQTAIVEACGPNNWWVTSYRCHALALLLGAEPNALMAELYGRVNGNAKGRGGSMHFFTERMLGGMGIVGGQAPLGIGAAFQLKYTKNREEVAFCFLGDGAIAQGAFHESLNIAALWNLPIIFVIENNRWGMGTGVERAISVERIAEEKAPGYGIKGYSVDGMDLLACYAAFRHLFDEVRTTQRPVLVECVTERFKGHSISDPALYRSKDELKECMKSGPIVRYQKILEELGIVDQEQFQACDQAQKEVAIAAMKYAAESPWPDPATLEDDVYAP